MVFEIFLLELIIKHDDYIKRSFACLLQTGSNGLMDIHIDMLFFNSSTPAAPLSLFTIFLLFKISCSDNCQFL